MQKLRFDLRVVLRQLAKSPGFAITAVLMLALGIGATTAIFSIVEAVLLRPLPFPDSERLMTLSDRLEGVNLGGNNQVGVTAPDIKAYSRDTHGFTATGGYQPSGWEMSGNGEPAQVNGSRLTAGVFAALGVQPLMGRVFTADDVEHSRALDRATRSPITANAVETEPVDVLGPYRRRPASLSMSSYPDD